MLKFYAVLLSLNPWVYIVLAVAIWWFYNKYRDDIWRRIERWRQQRQEEADIAAIKKNPDAFRAKMEAMDEARRRLQDKYDSEARAAEERRLEKEAEAQRQRAKDLEDMMAGRGYRNKVRGTEDEDANKRMAAKAKLRPDYTPLMGHGSSGYRPSRRSNNRGG